MRMYTKRHLLPHHDSAFYLPKHTHTHRQITDTPVHRCGRFIDEAAEISVMLLKRGKLM